MRVLHLTPELPFAPGGSGGSTRQFHLLSRLAELGHEVEVVAPVHESQRPGVAVLRSAGFDLRLAMRPSSRLGETLTAAARRPVIAPLAASRPLLAWQVEVFWSRLMGLATRAIHDAPPDVICVEHDWAAAWHRDLPDGIPRVMTLHNLSWAYYEARARAAGGPRGRALAAEARRFRRHDARHLPAYDRLVAMSDQDREAVASVASVPCDVVPNGVDTTALRPAPEPDAGPPLFVFTGTLSYPPNAEGLAWLLRDVWPRIRGELPDARLRVVGRNPPADAVRMAGPEVELTGWVESMAPHFAAASVVLVPILSGGGTRLKVLDAMAAGRAMVSTPAGYEGVDVEPDAHLLAASDAEGFAAAAVRLAGDPGLRRTLAAAARERAVSHYDWSALGDRLAGVLEDATR